MHKILFWTCLAIMVFMAFFGLFYFLEVLTDLIFNEYMRYQPAVWEYRAPKLQTLVPDQLVVKMAKIYGLNPDKVYRLARLESQFDCAAKNPKSSAGGLFQFINSTWIGKRKQFGLDPDLNLKFNCYENAKTAMLTLAAGEYHHWQSW